MPPEERIWGLAPKPFNLFAVVQIVSFGLFVGVGDIVSPLRTCSDRAGMVIAGGDDRDQALALADWVMDRVTVETEQEPEGL